MRVQITGIHNSVSERELRGAAHFFARQLFTSQTRKKLVVTLEFDGLGDSLYKGFCEYVDRRDRPREFVIGIRRTLSRKSALKTLAHEMVHVWQYAAGHMADCDLRNGSEGTKWRGRKFNFDRVSYWDSPWEIDAYGREVGLFVRYELWHCGRYAAKKRKTSKR